MQHNMKYYITPYNSTSYHIKPLAINPLRKRRKHTCIKTISRNQVCAGYTPGLTKKLVKSTYLCNLDSFTNYDHK